MTLLSFFIVLHSSSSDLGSDIFSGTTAPFSPCSHHFSSSLLPPLFDFWLRFLDDFVQLFSSLILTCEYSVLSLLFCYSHFVCNSFLIFFLSSFLPAFFSSSTLYDLILLKPWYDNEICTLSSTYHR